MKWINAKDELPIIKKHHSRTDLPIYVILDNGILTIADFSKSKFIGGIEWVGVNYEPIWICRQRGVDISGQPVNVVSWFTVPIPND